MYYDSRSATVKAAVSSMKPATPTSVGHPNGTAAANGTGQQQYEAGLATLATVNTVESFCRLYNWLKKPGKLTMNENLHFFKDQIRPMWEDERNKNGGKWTVCLEMKLMNSREMLDRMWMYLCFALVSVLKRPRMASVANVSGCTHRSAKTSTTRTTSYAALLSPSVPKRIDSKSG